MINRVNELADSEPEIGDLVHTPQLKQSGMLVVPVILLEDGLVVDHLGHPGSPVDCSFADPVKMARLWRVQNAAVIHIVDRASTLHGREIDFESINRITRCLDIPVQLEGAFTESTAAEALNLSHVARLAPAIDSLAESSFLAIAEQFGSNKICPILTHDLSQLSAKADGGLNQVLTGLEKQIDFITRAGCRRAIVRDLQSHHNLSGHNTDVLSSVARKYPRVRFSAAGGIGNYRDLKTLEIDCPRNVDSVIINRALYENRFPCQQMWCWHTKEQVDLEKFSSARLKT